MADVIYDKKEQLDKITRRGDYEFEFRGADKAHAAHDLILGHMPEG